jgi:hypothetical protein
MIKKITSKQGVENLRTLYAVMVGIPGRAVDLDTWRGTYNNASDERLLKDCGTAACAVGWACAYPEFKAQGLGFDTTHGEPYMKAYPGKQRLVSWTAVREFFWLTNTDAHAIFTRGHGGHDFMSPNGIRYKEGEAPKDHRLLVLRRIRRLLLRDGVITPKRNAELALQEGSIP